MTAKNERPAAKRFTPELITEAAKLRESGMTWDAIGAKLDVRSTGLLSKRVREADAAKKTPAKRKPARAPRPAAKATPKTTTKEA